MPTEENTAIARRFAQVWGKESLTTIDELADPNLTVAYPILGDVLRGPAAFKQFLTGFHAAFPDADTTIEDAIAEGDKVAIRWTLRGTHQGGGFCITPRNGALRLNVGCLLLCQACAPIARVR